MNKKTKAIFYNLKEIIFPEYCLGCYRTIEKEKFLPFVCQNCFSKIEISNFVFCPICRKPIPIIYKKNKKIYHIQPCYHSQKKYLSWLGAATFFDNQIIKNLIENYKYKFLKNIYLTLSTILLIYLEKTHLKEIIKKEGWSIVPIPLYSRRKKWRGFNQSELIAKEISNYLKIDYLPNILNKVKPTKEQALLSLEERITNIKDAFQVNKKNRNILRKRKIIILDDVFTSGATLKEAAKILKENGASRVAGLVVSMARN